MHQSGIYAGPDISANYWPPLDRLLQKFPRLKLVLAHGGYPAVIDALSLAVKHQNFYLSPDIYCFAPAGELYVNAISKLPDQFIFGTAYPLGGLKASVEGVLRFPLSDDVMTKYLHWQRSQTDEGNVHGPRIACMKNNGIRFDLALKQMPMKTGLVLLR